MDYSWHENGDISQIYKWIILKYELSTKREYSVLFKGIFISESSFWFACCGFLHRRETQE